MTQSPTARLRDVVLRPVAVVILLAVAFTLLNAIKPLHIDDPFMHRVAEQMATQPLDPYGFEIMWMQWPQPAYEELTPPVQPMWWSLGLCLLGGNPFLWKLWLFPFALIFAVSLYAILRRFAPGIEVPLVALTLFSPTFLPSFNLMQDVPAEALGLGALALYLRSSDRESLSWAAAAGVVAGLALQTKYTVVAVVAVLLIHALMHRRWREGVCAASLALLVFFAWEWVMVLLYGRSMLLGQVGGGVFELYRFAKSQLILPLVRLLGATSPLIALLGLMGAGLPSRPALVAAAAAFLGCIGLLWFSFAQALFTVSGLLVCVALVYVAWKSIVTRGGLSIRGHLRLRTEWFLILWLIVEVGVYFAATPFPAVRRVMGIVIAATVLCGHLLASRRAEPGRGRALTVLVVLGVLLGLLYQVVDIREARAQRDAVLDAEALLRENGAEGTVWFLGHWGFQFYAERAGMQPVIPDHSFLERGDWLVVPDRVDKQEIALSMDDVEPFHELHAQDSLPLITGYGFYGGSTPLSHHGGPRLSTTIYKIKHDVVPPSAWPVHRVAAWAKYAGRRSRTAAIPALARALHTADARGRAVSAEALASLGPSAVDVVPALVRALGDGDAVVRYWSATALGRIGQPARIAVPQLRVALKDPVAEVRFAAQGALSEIEK